MKKDTVLYFGYCIAIRKTIDHKNLAFSKPQKQKMSCPFVNMRKENSKNFTIVSIKTKQSVDSCGNIQQSYCRIFYKSLFLGCTCCKTAYDKQIDDCLYLFIL